VPNVLVVNPAVPARDGAQLVALAKAKPGALRYASGGNGSAAHIAMEYLKLRTQTDIGHLPCRGTSPAVTDVMGGQVEIIMTGAHAAGGDRAAQRGDREGVADARVEGPARCGRRGSGAQGDIRLPVRQAAVHPARSVPSFQDMATALRPCRKDSSSPPTASRRQPCSSDGVPPVPCATC